MPRGRHTRLTDSPEFERAYRLGSAYRGKLFSVHAFPNDMGAARLGMSVSKKVGNAVVRNTVRRRIREIFHSAGAESLGERDIVVSARPIAAKATYEELETEFRRSLEKLGSAKLPEKA